MPDGGLVARSIAATSGGTNRTAPTAIAAPTASLATCLVDQASARTPRFRAPVRDGRLGARLMPSDSRLAIGALPQALACHSMKQPTTIASGREPKTNTMGAPTAKTTPMPSSTQVDRRAVHDRKRLRTLGVRKKTPSFWTSPRTQAFVTVQPSDSMTNWAKGTSRQRARVAIFSAQPNRTRPNMRMKIGMTRSGPANCRKAKGWPSTTAGNVRSKKTPSPAPIASLNQISPLAR